MELLLLQDISGVGKKNDIIIVGDGFALNCLLPQRKALVATPTVRKRYADQIKRRAEERETERKIVQQVVTALAGKSVTFSRKAAKNGKLYAGITDANISTAIHDQLGLEISEGNIEIADHIKALGTFTVQLKVGEMRYPLSVIVTEDKGK